VPIKPISAESHVVPRTVRGSLTLALGVAACLATPVLAADEETMGRALDALNPYASIGYGYDSNIFRYDDEVDPVPGGRSDQFAMFSAGFESNLQVSQQKFELSGEISHTLFNDHDDLDYTGGKAAAIWHWSAGTALAGDAGYRFRRSLRDFANQSNLDKRQDIRTEHQLLAGADVDLPGPWKTGVRAEFSDIAFSDSDTLDMQRTTFGADVGYVSAAGNAVGFDAEFVTADYDINPIANFDEYTVGPTLEYKLTTRTQLDAKIGYTSRDNESPTRADYDGITGRVTVSMADDGRNQLKAEAWRDLSNLGDEIAEYAVVNGVSIEPSWTLTDKLDLRIEASYENRDFQVDPLQSDRQDDVVTAGAFLDWEVTRNIKVSVGVDTERRSSNRALQDYDFNRFQVQVIGHL
jgi:hypothetical protein